MGHLIRVRDVICNTARKKNIQISEDDKEKLRSLFDRGDEIADLLQEIKKEDIPDVLTILLGDASDNIYDYTTKLRNALL